MLLLLLLEAATTDGLASPPPAAVPLEVLGWAGSSSSGALAKSTVTCSLSRDSGTRGFLLSSSRGAQGREAARTCCRFSRRQKNLAHALTRTE